MDLSPWYRVCIKVIFISKGSYGYGETRNVFPYSVLKPLLPVSAIKLLCLKGVGIGPRMQTCVNWGGPIATVLCLHQNNIYIKRMLQVWRVQKCIFLVGVKTLLTCAGHQTTPSQGSRYRTENGNLCKIGWSYLHSTVFAPIQYLYQKEATGMERQEMYFPSRCKTKTPLTYAGRQTTPSHERRYRVENGKLRILGWIYLHGTVFARRQYLYQKEATGMESQEMYSPSRCKTPSYLCGPSNYSVTREAI